MGDVMLIFDILVFVSVGTLTALVGLVFWKGLLFFSDIMRRSS